MKNLIGLRFDKLKVLEQKRENNRTYCYCECDCGNKLWIRADSLKSGKTRSCGCSYNKRYFDIKGKKFGRLTALEPCFDRKNHTSMVWKCQCECGNIVYVSQKLLESGKTRSCGCLKREIVRKNLIDEKIDKLHIEGTYVPALKSKIRKNNTSGFIGVCWNKRQNKWQAQITFKNKNYNLGTFDDIKEAIKIRKQAEEKLFGKFLEWYENNIKGK